MIGSPSAILACAGARWSPQIGDPTPMGWWTVMAYFIAAAAGCGVLALRRRAPLETRRRETLFWAVCVLALVALGVNKQLDLQSGLTALGRCASKAEGWYEARRAVQAAFIAVVLVAATGGAVLLLRQLRGALRRNGLAALGMAFLSAFIVIRAAGFHHMDRLIGTALLGWRMNWVFELGGLALVTLGAARAAAGLLRLPPRSQSRRSRKRSENSGT